MLKQYVSSWWISTWLFPLHKRHTPGPLSGKPSTPQGLADTRCHRRASPLPRYDLCLPRTPSLLRPWSWPPWDWQPTWSGRSWLWRWTFAPGWWAWCPGLSSPVSSRKGECVWSGSRIGPGDLTWGWEPPRRGTSLMRQRGRMDRNIVMIPDY